MPTVFVPQEPSKFDRATDLWIPTVDLKPAEEFGKLAIMMPPGAARLPTPALVRVLKERLAHWQLGDYFIAVGSPVLIAASIGIIVREKKVDCLNLLTWDKFTRSYKCAEIVL